MMDNQPLSKYVVMVLLYLLDGVNLAMIYFISEVWQKFHEIGNKSFVFTKFLWISLQKDRRKTPSQFSIIKLKLIDLFNFTKFFIFFHFFRENDVEDNVQFLAIRFDLFFTCFLVPLPIHENIFYKLLNKKNSLFFKIIIFLYLFCRCPSIFFF